MNPIEIKNAFAREYSGLPFNVLYASAILAADDRRFDKGRQLGNTAEISFNIAMHPNASHKIMHLLPGMDGDINGFNDKYLKIACLVQNSKIAAVVRSRNTWHPGFSFEHDFRFAIEHASSNSYAICGEVNPDMYLMGYAAGAGIMGALAHEYPNVKKILLINPTGEMGERIIETGLSKFSGEIMLAIGENDLDSLKFGRNLFENHTNEAKTRKLLIIPKGDHQLRGRDTGIFLSKLPFIAFDNNSEYTKKFKGIELY